MTLIKYIEIDCDGCGCAIDFYNGTSKRGADRFFRLLGGIVHGKAHFCNKECIEKLRIRNESMDF